MVILIQKIYLPQPSTSNKLNVMKTTLSQKKQDLLYNCVHKKIMDARIETISFLKSNNLPCEEIDKIFYKLCASTPKEALRCFELKNK